VPKIITDICILGSGMVGLSLAHQILERFKNLRVTIIEKEKTVGLHSSGRNSGVLHSGLYYPADSLKAKVCIPGAKKLKAWCKENGLEVFESGKIITAQHDFLDPNLDLLFNRGRLNGAEVEIIDEREFKKILPHGRTASGRALWSKSTCIVDPIKVIQKLRDNISSNKRIRFLFSERSYLIDVKKKIIKLRSGNNIHYDFLFNCSGSNADKIAHEFGIGREYKILPFRGSYWEIKRDAPFKFETNLYPVPDLNFPFLGVHITPGLNGSVYIGPTAVPAFGRENYNGIKNIEPRMFFDFMGQILRKSIFDKKIRRYIYDQAFDWLPIKLIKSVNLIAPEIRLSHIKRSQKVGIRAQLFDNKNKEFINDFVMLEGNDSSHILNAVSPAFTASFELADYIIHESVYFN